MVLKRIKKKYYLISLVFILILSAKVTVYADENPVSVPLTVKQTFDITNISDKKDIDTAAVYELSVVSPDAPMPEDSRNGKFTFTLDANNPEYILPLVFTHEGEFQYEIKQITGKKDFYSYDNKVYQVHIWIKNDGKTGLVPQVVVDTRNSEKCDEIVFNNRYNNDSNKETNNSQKDKTEKNTKTESKNKNVKTGDSSNRNFYLVVWLLSMIMIIAIWRKMKE